MTREQMVQNIERRTNRVIAELLQGEKDILSLIDLHAEDPAWDWLEGDLAKQRGLLKTVQLNFDSFKRREQELAAQKTT